MQVFAVKLPYLSHEDLQNDNRFSSSVVDFTVLVLLDVINDGKLYQEVLVIPYAGLQNV